MTLQHTVFLLRGIQTATVAKQPSGVGPTLECSVTPLVVHTNLADAVDMQWME